MAHGLQTFTSDGKLQIALSSKMIRLFARYTQYVPGYSGATPIGPYYYHSFTLNIPEITVPSEWAAVVQPEVLSIGTGTVVQASSVNRIDIGVGSITIGIYAGWANYLKIAVLRVG